MLIHSQKKRRGLRVLEAKGIMVKAVMVYIKVVLKPPSASHNSEAIQGSPRRNMYIKKSKKGIKKGIRISNQKQVTILSQV
jgi:hypothetical protein